MTEVPGLTASHWHRIPPSTINLTGHCTEIYFNGFLFKRNNECFFSKLWAVDKPKSHKSAKFLFLKNENDCLNHDFFCGVIKYCSVNIFILREMKLKVCFPS